MGRAGKTRRSEEKKKKKRAAKDQQRALYAARRDAGKNKKSFRARKRAANTRKVGRPSRHPIEPCGNVGCRSCSPLFAVGGALAHLNQGAVNVHG